jgi:hypothetical protein
LKEQNIMKTGISVVLACMLLVGVAFGDKHHHKGSGGQGDQGENEGGGGFRSGVIGSTPGLTIGGIMSGGAPWVVREAKASLTPSGELELEVKGLLIGPGVTGAGTTGPVTQIAASLVCGGSGGTVVATSPAVNLSPEGDAEIEAKLTLPTTPCFGTVILVRVAGLNGTPIAMPLPTTAPFIAVTGFIPHSGGGDDQGGDDQGGDN